MRPFLIPGILASAALCLGPSLAAAPQAPYYQQSRPYYYGDGASAPAAGDFRAGQMLFSAVRADLDRAENNLPAYTSDRYRFDRVRGELSELQRQWDESAYEPRQADNVVRSLDRALDSNDLLPRDRNRLSTDLDQLRGFRDDHE
jgi:hypothetical protein